MVVVKFDYMLEQLSIRWYRKVTIHPVEPISREGYEMQSSKVLQTEELKLVVDRIAEIIEVSDDDIVFIYQSIIKPMGQTPEAAQEYVRSAHDVRSNGYRQIKTLLQKHKLLKKD